MGRVQLVRLYRVTNERHANNFSGKGASYEDGARWNRPGTPVIYFALDMATALVEAANYHPSPRLMPPSHCKAIYEVSGNIVVDELDLSRLPDDWQDMPYPSSTQMLGETFFQQCHALLLLVPSVGVGLANEYSMAVCNPLHPQISRISLVDIIKPVYSTRMFIGTSP